MTNDLKTPRETIYRKMVNRFKNIYFLRIFFKLLNPGRRVEINHILANSNLKKEHAVLDIGCGDGYWTNHFARRAGRVSGIDPYLTDIEKAKKYALPNTEYSKGTAEELGFQPGSFDRVVSVCVFEHLFNDKKAFEEIYRVLKPGGVLSATVDSLVHPSIPVSFIENHKTTCYCNQLYTKESIAEKLKDAGFSAVDAYYIMGSTISVKWEMLTEKAGVFAYFLIPLIYPFVLVSEGGKKKHGYKLAVKATK